MTDDERARMDRLIPSLDDVMCSLHGYEGESACPRCTARRDAYEASIVAEPTSREAGVAEALTLILKIAEMALSRSTSPFKSRRAKFLVGWLANQSAS